MNIDIHINYVRRYMFAKWRPWLINFKRNTGKHDTLYELTVLGFLTQVIMEHEKGTTR